MAFCHLEKAIRSIARSKEQSSSKGLKLGSQVSKISLCVRPFFQSLKILPSFLPILFPAALSQIAFADTSGVTIGENRSAKMEVLTDRQALFDLQRARLFGIAYRMLGSKTDAEDMLQETYLRWHQAKCGRSAVSKSVAH